MSRRFKVIGICASPRRGGNSETLLDRALEGVRAEGSETEKIVLSELDYSPCTACGGCNKTGRCVIDDDMGAVYRKIDEADGLIIATPIFFASVTAQLKAMIDRMQSEWVKKYVLKKTGHRRKKLGALICVSGSRIRKFFVNARLVVRVFFATLDVEYQGEMIQGGIDERDSIHSNKPALDRAYALGTNLAVDIKKAAAKHYGK